MVSILEVPEENLTPGMKQYKDAKLENPDCLILLRMGDFYEIFYEDAKIAARDLEITLTSRGKGERKAPLAGIPYHALDSYLGKLVSKGHKVAIIEQLEDPKEAKGLVKRGCVRIVTPGTLIETTLLEATENNYVTSLFCKGDLFYYCFADLSTGEIISGKANSHEDFISEVERFGCAELVIPNSLMVNRELINYLRNAKIFLSPFEDFYFKENIARSIIETTFGENFVNKFKLPEDDVSEITICVGSLLNYLQETQKKKLKHFKKIAVKSKREVMSLDRSTLRNLELVTNQRGEKGKGTLFSVIDKTTTSAGSRLLKSIIKEPLLNIHKIKLRQDAVEELSNNPIMREEICSILKEVYDLGRLIGRVNYGCASPKDLVALRSTFEKLPEIKKLLREANSTLLQEIGKIEDFSELKKELLLAIKEEPNTLIREGGVIAEGYNLELDELFMISKNSKKVLHQIAEKEKEITGISNLRISYNRVFGYFLEVSKKQSDKVPEHYMRKQTLANAERFITEELKVLEDKILGAQEKILEIEFNIFNELIACLAKETEKIQEVALSLAKLDVLCSHAKVAVEYNYERPILNNGNNLIIEDGRHPVVERLQDEFIPNSVKLTDGEMMIITGPNTSGKSTIMRQTALIVLLAQIGSFVPARKCEIGIVDQIFTRVGAHDDLSEGQSTFMVEMLETANILKNASSKSLIILDEIGRGTSTFDGVAIAWSTAEFIYNQIKAKTMFATHYHVLNKLSDHFDNIHNFNVAVREISGEIVFLRKLVAGGCDASHGIHVARMAGMPRDLVVRALEIQKKLESEDKMREKVNGKKVREQMDLSGFAR